MVGHVMRKNKHDFIKLMNEGIIEGGGVMAHHQGNQFTEWMDTRKSERHGRQWIECVESEGTKKIGDIFAVATPLGKAPVRGQGTEHVKKTERGIRNNKMV